MLNTLSNYLSTSGTTISKLAKSDWVTNLIPTLCEIKNYRLLDILGEPINPDFITFNAPNYEIIHTNKMLLTDLKMQVEISSDYETVMTNLFTYSTKLPKSQDYFS